MRIVACCLCRVLAGCTLQIQTLQSNVQTLEGQCAQLTTQLAAVKADKEQARESASSLKVTVSSLNSQVAGLMEELTLVRAAPPPTPSGEHISHRVHSIPSELINPSEVGSGAACAVVCAM